MDITKFQPIRGCRNWYTKGCSGCPQAEHCQVVANFRLCEQLRKQG